MSKYDSLLASGYTKKSVDLLVQLLGFNEGNNGEN